MNDQSQMLNRSFSAWPPKFSSANPNFKKWSSTSSDYYNEIRRNDPLGVTNIYKYPNQTDIYAPNRSNPRKFHPKKKFNRRFVPYAPRNTTSFLIRAKKSGGITSLVSPCPVTPAVLPTPIFSPSREVLVDTAKEEWGVNGYGSMSGLIRLRQLGKDVEEEEEEVCGLTSDSDVEERVGVERRLDHDLSRFEMIYPNNNGGEMENMLENRVDEQDGYIGRVQEENMTLKERLFIMEREMEDMRRRVLVLEMRRGNGRGNGEDLVSENGSDNEGGGDVCSGRSVGVLVMTEVI